MDIIYRDALIAVCIKPAGVLSTDEPGGMPSLAREALGEACVRTVHRLDRVVSGLMLLALNADAASAVSAQIRDGGFKKEYLAVLHGRPPEASATLRDLLARDKRERKTYVAEAPGKGVQEAVLNYSVLAEAEGLSLVRIELLTGRTHQIRAQFSSRNLPIVGDRKYSLLDDGCDIALWSYSLRFAHPGSGETVSFSQSPPETYPWRLFSGKFPR